MIEFLGEKLSTASGSASLSFDVSGNFHNVVGTEKEKIMICWRGSKGLCDALWQATKEVLEK
jgi:hypothetical protein